MRILIVDDSLEHGHLSVPRLSRQHALFLAARGHEVSLLGTVRNAEEAGSWRRDGIQIIAFDSSYPPRFRPWVGLYNHRVLRPLSRFLSRFQPEIVHFHNVHTYVSYSALRLASRHGAKVFLTAHDVMLFWEGKLTCFNPSTRQEEVESDIFNYRSRWRDRVAHERLRYLPFRQVLTRRLVNRHTTRIVAVSDCLRRALLQNGFESVAIHNGVEASAMDVGDRQISRFRERYHLTGRRVLLFGGRLSRLKGGEHLLEGVARLRSWRRSSALPSCRR